MGRHTLNAWSVTQNVILLSSGEAEYYGMVKGAAMAKGTQAIMADMGCETQIRAMGHSQVHTDSSEAAGIVTRKGLGAVRHIEVSQLWVQHEVASGRKKIVTVKGTNSIADILTQHSHTETLETTLQVPGRREETGQTSIEPCRGHRQCADTFVRRE